MLNLVEMTITQKDLIDYSILSRRANELIFKRDYLLQNGASQEDAHIHALNSSIDETKVNLIPLEKKIKTAGILTVVLHRTTIDELSDSINEHTIVEMMEAAKSRTGELYEKMKKRGKLARENYEKKEELAALILILNSMPQTDAEEIKEAVENFSVSEDWAVDVSYMPIDKQRQLIQILNRLGFVSSIKNNKLIHKTIHKTSEKGVVTWLPETQRKIHNKKVWISNLLIDKFDENEEKLVDVTRGIQAMTTKRQVQPFSTEQENRFEELQKQYLACITKREQMINGEAPSEIKIKHLDKTDLNKIAEELEKKE